MTVRRKKIKLKYKKERVLFSDVLPYETPIIFTNRFYYRFLVSNGVYAYENYLKWNNQMDDGAYALLKLIFKIEPTVSKSTGSTKIKDNQLINIPFVYKISHKETKFRELSIIHPANQIMIISFYEKFKHLILHYCNQSSYSLRHPDKVACYFYYKDRLHHQLLGKKADKLEMYFNEYENLRSFFTYKKYSNIYKFYEDYRYQRAEKKFKHLLKFDLQSCFDSIYTHSIAWATSGGKEVLKSCINKYGAKSLEQSFGSQFDLLMERMNHNETNGILIGPELSRIFAEIILQYIDKRIEYILKCKNIFNYKNYECYRYVDDYFLFYNDESTKDYIMQEFINILKEFKLNISDSKTKNVEKPFITDITRAKIEIDTLLKDYIGFKNTIPHEEKTIIDCDQEVSIEEQNVLKLLDEKNILYLVPNIFNQNYKTLIKEKNVEYKDVLNYTLARMINKLESVLNKFDKKFKILTRCINSEEISEELKRDCEHCKNQEEKMITKYILGILDIVFFLYSNNKRINTTLKLLSILNIIILYFKNDYENEGLKKFTDNCRSEVFKKIQDEINLVFQSTPFSENAQLETLYLLVALKEIRSIYYLNPAVIDNYLGIEYHLSTDNIVKKPQLNAFSIIILLYYYGNSRIYQKSKSVLLGIIIEKYQSVEKEQIVKHAELLILALDIISCPFVDSGFKSKIMQMINVEISEYAKIEDYMKRQKFWFTRWSGVDLNKELNAKISQEVYS